MNVFEWETAGANFITQKTISKEYHQTTLDIP